jgi:UDP-N-acetylglucosamine 2-epimerase
MPTEFWNWDIESKKNIDDWSSKTETVNAKVVGQPYLGYWINKINNGKDPEKKFILYSLQTHPFTIETLITPKIISLIKLFEFNWVFRMHPRNNLNLDELDGFLKLNKIKSKVIVQDAFNTPLPEVITKSILHITNYSGCLIEALQLGTPTLLINEVGMEMFKQYIDNNLVNYLDITSDNFMENATALIQNLKVTDFKANHVGVFNPLS